MVSCLPVHAQTNNPDAFQRGIQAYHEGNFQAVVTEMNNTLRSRRLDQPQFRWVKNDAYKYLGIANAKLGNEAASLRAFRNLLELNSNYVLGETVGEKVLAIFSIARNNITQTPRGRGKGWLKIVIPAVLVAGGAAVGIPLLMGSDSGNGSGGNDGLVGAPPTPPPR